MKAWPNNLLEYLMDVDPKNTDIEQAQKIKDLYIPSKLYRYRSICKAEKDLRTKKVALVPPTFFSDPFDSASSIIYQTFESNTIKKSIKENSMLENGFGDFFSKKEIETLKEDAIESTEPRGKIIEQLDIFFERVQKKTGKTLTEQQKENFRDDFRQQIKQGTEQGKRQLHDILRKKIKSCCFSENNNSLVMWSHYAEQHKGVCIEYDFSNLDSDNSRRLQLFPIIYKNKLFNATPYIKKWMDSNEFNPFLPLLASIHKAKEWEYEAEWRLIHDEPNRLNQVKLFEMPIPSKIILGANVEEQNKSKIQSIAEEQDIPIAKMEVAENQLQLEVKDF